MMAPEERARPKTVEALSMVNNVRVVLVKLCRRGCTTVRTLKPPPANQHRISPRDALDIYAPSHYRWALACSGELEIWPSAILEGRSLSFHCQKEIKRQAHVHDKFLE